MNFYNIPVVFKVKNKDKFISDYQSLPDFKERTHFKLASQISIDCRVDETMIIKFLQDENIISITSYALNIDPASALAQTIVNSGKMPDFQPEARTLPKDVGKCWCTIFAVSALATTLVLSSKLYQNSM